MVLQPTPNPAPPGNALGVLRAVSCTFALIAPVCTAVGGQGAYAPSQFALRRQGLTWTVQSMPAPSTSSILFGVSCTSANACTAVGGYVPDGSPYEHAFAE